MDKKNFTDSFSDIVDEYAIQFEAAYDKKDKEHIAKLIEKAKEEVGKADIANQSRLYYSIATAYADILDIIYYEKKEEIEFQEEIQVNVIFYFRKCIDLLEGELLRRNHAI